MSNWQKLKGKLTSQGVMKPKVEAVEASQPVNEGIDGKRKQKQLVRESNVATIKAQHLRHFVKSKYIGLDCEMVGLGLNGKESALARCCCVDFDGNTLYDKFVRPQGFVTDFRTEWSGVRKKDLRQGQAIPFSQCQEEVAELLKGRILVGHALKNDLDVLMLSHPRQMIRDTAKYRPYMRTHGRHGKFRPRALKDLTQQFLGVKIQSGEHDPAEDANSAMQLYRLKMEEWEEGLRESKVKAKQAATDKQKGVKEGAKEKDGKDNKKGSGGGGSVPPSGYGSDSESVSDEDSSGDDEGEDGHSDESSEEDEPVQKHQKKSSGSKSHDKKKSAKQTDEKRDAAVPPAVKRKVLSNSMFGAPVMHSNSGSGGEGGVGGSKLKSIADIDMEMAAKKRKLKQ